MKILRDFHCPACDTVTERFIDAQTETVTCPVCKGTAKRTLNVGHVKLEGITGDFPGAHDRWARIREDNARIKSKHNA